MLLLGNRVCVPSGKLRGGDFPVVIATLVTTWRTSVLLVDP